MVPELKGIARHIISRVLAANPEARALQINGVLRFLIILSQGIILVKAGTALELVGQIEFLLFAVSFLSFFFLNGGRNAMLSYRKRGDKRGPEISLVPSAFLAFHGFAVLACLLLGVIASLPDTGRLALLSGESVTGFLAVFLFFSIASGPMEYAYVMQGSLRRMIAASTGFQFLQLLAVVLPVIIAGSLEMSIMALALTGALRWLFTVFDLQWLRRGHLDWTHVGLFLGFAAPLILHSLMGGVMDYVDNWIVSWFYGDAQFAIYRYGARELPVNMLLIGGLTGGLIHRFRRDGEVSARQLRHEISRLMDILFPLTALLVLLSPLLYVFVYSGEFILSARIFNMYAFTLIARIIVNQVILYHHQKNWLLLLAATGELALNIVLSLVLMRMMGILGIPLATIVAYIVHRIAISWYISGRFRLKFGEYVPVTKFALYTVMLIACFCIAEWIYFS